MTEAHHLKLFQLKLFQYFGDLWFLYNTLLLKIESSEYRGTGKCTAVHTTPKKYHGIPVYQYFCTPLIFTVSGVFFYIKYSIQEKFL